MTRDELPLLLELTESFIDDNWITEVLDFVKGGKEATVFRCRAADERGGGYVAAKVYRPRQYRRFRDDAAYQHGRSHGKHREERAFRNKTRFGQQVQYGAWVGAEFATQRALSDAGADVPRPLACNGSAILMEWLGDDRGPAPQLKDVTFASTGEAFQAFRRVMRNVEILLANHLVHGDLSPFNILHWDGRPVVIDFPQAVDARSNGNAFPLFRRDVENVCTHFARFGVREDATRLAGRLWARYLRAELVPGHT